MAQGGLIGNGSKVAFSLGSPGVWIRVAQLLDIPKFLSLVSADVDTTVHSASRVMTSAPGMIPVPEIQLSLEADLDETTTPSHELLRGYQVAGTTLWWRVEIPTDRAQGAFRPFEFQAFVKEWTPDVTKIAQLQKLAITLRYAGNLSVYNHGASAIT